MDLVCIDLETYFDDEYSLKRMTTEEYVRDSRFKIHCVGYKIGAAPAQVSAGLPDIDWGKAAVLCHHANFDLLALNHWHGIRPAFILDTLSLARLVHPHAPSFALEKLALSLRPAQPGKCIQYQLFKGRRELDSQTWQHVADGCKQDVELTYDLFKIIAAGVPQEELRIIDQTVRLFTEPCLTLDTPLLQQYLDKTRADKASLLTSLGVTKADLQSGDKFAELLRSVGVEPPTKPSPSNPAKTVYAFAKTDAALKELGEHADARVQVLVAARLGQKSTIGETRAERLIQTATRGALPVYLNYCGAHTTRWSGGGKMNFQNFPRGGDMRKSILAPAGHVLVVGDLAQIECRVLNWLAQQWDVLEKFKSGADVYSELATQFYGEPVDKSKPEKRGTGKQIELSCGFGAGADSIKETARRGTYGPPVILTDMQALAARDLYRRTHPKVKELWHYAGSTILECLLHGGHTFSWGPMLIKGACIYMPNSAFIDYTNLGRDGKDFYQMRRGAKSKTYGGKVVQNVVEGLARCILAQAALKIGARYKPVLLTHDEIVCVAPEAKGQAALDFILETLRTPPTWGINIPLDAEGGYARNYSK